MDIGSPSNYGFHPEIIEENCITKGIIYGINGCGNVQIFTTTHNTDLMSNDLLRPDCYFLLKDNSIKAISELTEKELRQAHNLQKMYKAGAFNG